MLHFQVIKHIRHIIVLPSVDGYSDNIWLTFTTEYKCSMSNGYIDTIIANKCCISKLLPIYDKL